MAGLFPSIANSQNVDANGRPLANSVLSVFVGGTVGLANVFTDINLQLTGQNPMTADITGRLPLFYVADGVYRVRLVDATGILIYDYLQVSSIGASSSGGGGTTVDPTTIFSTGDELWKKIGGTRVGWVRQNALTIGSATSGASERANADCNALFLYLWNNYPNTKCPVVGGRGGSAAADWAANKQITLPDMRGFGNAGKDGMGAARANRIADTDVTSGGTDTGDTDAAFGGADVVAIGQANLPNIGVSFSGTQISNLGFTATINQTSLGGGGVGSPQTGYGTGAGGALKVANFTPAGGLIIGANTPSAGVTQLGSGTNLPIMNPFVLGTWYIKL